MWSGKDLDKFASQRDGDLHTKIKRPKKATKAKKSISEDAVSEMPSPEGVIASPQNSELDASEFNSPSSQLEHESLQDEEYSTYKNAAKSLAFSPRHPHADLKGRVKYFKTMSVKEKYRRCSKIVDVLVEKEGANVFREEVPREIYPDYYRQIKKPMYVDLIIEKLRNKQYKHMPMGFAGDMRLVWRNCMAYNNEGSPIHELAKSHSIIFERLFEQWVVGGTSKPPAVDELDDDCCQICKKDPPEQASKLLLCDSKSLLCCISPGANHTAGKITQGLLILTQ
jgi:hypothetical protein